MNQGTYWKKFFLKGGRAFSILQNIFPKGRPWAKSMEEIYQESKFHVLAPY